jgi:hypothetical protein
MERIAGKSNENIYQQLNKKKGLERQKTTGKCETSKRKLNEG